MAAHLILCILLDEEREVPGCRHENVSCLLCGEERQNPGHHSLPLSDTHDLYKVVITWPAGDNLNQQEQCKKPTFSSHMLLDEHNAFIFALQ